jgi:hypothetical protein
MNLRPAGVPFRSKLNTAPQPRGSSLLRQRVVGMALQFGVADRRTIVAGEVATTLRVLSTWRAMRSGRVSTPCSNWKAVMRAHAGAEVAQALAARAQQEGGDGGFLAEIHAVEAGS